jgi:hypothetical protein
MLIYGLYAYQTQKICLEKFRKANFEDKPNFKKKLYLLELCRKSNFKILKIIHIQISKKTDLNSII